MIILDRDKLDQTTLLFLQGFPPNFPRSPGKKIVKKRGQIYFLERGQLTGAEALLMRLHRRSKGGSIESARQADEEAK